MMETVYVLLIAAGLLTVLVVNEAGHGAVAEATGFGHHHMFDYGGYHCAAHDDAEHARYHYEHMHGQAYNDSTNRSYGPGYHPHAACYGQGHPMHQHHAAGEEGHMGSGPHMGGG